MRVIRLERLLAVLSTIGSLVLAVNVAAQPTVVSTIKIAESQGNFGGVLDDGDTFHAVAAAGDIDGDGVPDLAVGADRDDDGGASPGCLDNAPADCDRGAVWILFLNADGTVRDEQKISDTQGNFGGSLDDSDRFGISVAAIGDLNGDQISELAVGTHRDDDGGTDRGAVWILFLNADGTVQSEQKISDTAGNFGGALTNGNVFGVAVGALGDIDGDGVVDLGVGATNDSANGPERGAVWILFLDVDGTVKSEQKINDSTTGFVGALGNLDHFGTSIASLGSLNGSDLALAVGTPLDDDDGFNRGAVWVLFLDVDTSGATPAIAIDATQKISSAAGDFTGPLDDGDGFGQAVSSFGDLDADGAPEIAVGAHGDDGDTIASNKGAVWILMLNSDGTVDSQQRIDENSGGFAGSLASNDNFGLSVSVIGDVNDGGTPDLSVGSLQDDDSGTDAGAAWVLLLDPTLDHYVLYKGKATKNPLLPDKGAFPKQDYNLQFDDVKLAPAADDPEIYQVKKSKSLALPAMKNTEVGPADPDLHYVRYQVKEAKEGLVFDASAGKFRKGARHLPRLWQLRNQFGTVNVTTRKVESVLVPATKSLPPATPPSSFDATHFECYKAKVTKAVTDQTPDSGGGGKFRKDIEATFGDQLDACALDKLGSPSFPAGTSPGKCLFNLKKVKFLCNPVVKSDVPGGQATIAPVGSNSTPAITDRCLLCYQIKLSSKILSADGVTLTGLTIGAKTNQAKFMKLRGVADAPLVDPANMFPGPLQMDITKPEFACIPSEVIGVNGVP